MSKLLINNYGMLFILNFVPEITEQYRNLSLSNDIPNPEPATITSSLQSALFFFYYKGYNAEGARVRIGKRSHNFYIPKFSSKSGTFSEIEMRFSEMERIYQSVNF